MFPLWSAAGAFSNGVFEGARGVFRVETPSIRSKKLQQLQESLPAQLGLFQDPKKSPMLEVSGVHGNAYKYGGII